MHLTEKVGLPRSAGCAAGVAGVEETWTAGGSQLQLSDVFALQGFW